MLTNAMRVSLERNMAEIAAVLAEPNPTTSMFHRASIAASQVEGWLAMAWADASYRDGMAHARELYGRTTETTNG